MYTLYNKYAIGLVSDDLFRTNGDLYHSLVIDLGSFTLIYEFVWIYIYIFAIDISRI